jgi:phosphatidylglycerol:prolipoprotein diacylglycerol transferase
MSLFQPSYFLFVGVAVVLALAFPVARHIREKGQRQQYYLLQAVTLLGAVVGAKLSVLLGDHHWPWTAVKDWHEVLWSGRSITGALIFGFLFAEITKPIIGYTMPPNDRFAALLPFTIGLGRIGCVTAGCCGGLSYDGWCSVHDAADVARYPTQWMEVVFQIGVGIAFQVMVRRGVLYGHLFTLYLVLYGAFRFLTEFIRDTPKTFSGLSGYQMLSLVMIVLGAAFFLKRKLWPSRSKDGQETSHV